MNTLNVGLPSGSQSGSTSTGLLATAEHAAPLAGRFLLSLIFLMSAVGKSTQFSGTAAMMQSKGMPAAPFFLVMALLFEIFGGLSVLTGFKARYGALALIVFLIPATLIFHNFWAYTGTEQMGQMTNFLKNLSIIGGLLLIASRGPGPISFDARAAKRE